MFILWSIASLLNLTCVFLWPHFKSHVRSEAIVLGSAPSGRPSVLWPTPRAVDECLLRTPGRAESVHCLCPLDEIPDTPTPPQSPRALLSPVPQDTTESLPSEQCRPRRCPVYPLEALGPPALLAARKVPVHAGPSELLLMQTRDGGRALAFSRSWCACLACRAVPEPPERQPLTFHVGGDRQKQIFHRLIESFKLPEFLQLKQRQKERMRLLSDDWCLPQKAPGHQPQTPAWVGEGVCGFLGCTWVCARVSLGHRSLERREEPSLFSVSPLSFDNCLKGRGSTVWLSKS